MTAADKTYKGWPLLDEMPEGWAINHAAGSPLHGYVFVTNCKSLISGERKTALLRVNKRALTEQKAIDKQLPAISVPLHESGKKKAAEYAFDKESSLVLNRLARESFKRKILQDILFDLTVCEIEGWSKREYIKELKLLINGIGKTRHIKTNQMAFDLQEKK